MLVCALKLNGVSMFSSSSLDGHDEENIQEQDEASLTNGGDSSGREVKSFSQHIPTWLSSATPDEFLVSLLKWSDYLCILMTLFLLLSYMNFTVKLKNLYRKL